MGCAPSKTVRVSTDNNEKQSNKPDSEPNDDDGQLTSQENDVNNNDKMNGNNVNNDVKNEEVDIEYSEKMTPKKSTNSLQTLNIEETKPVTNHVTSDETAEPVQGRDTVANKTRSISILTDDGGVYIYDDDVLQNDVEELSHVMSSTNPNEKQIIRLIVKGNEERLNSLKEIYWKTQEEELAMAIKRCTSGHVKSIITNILHSNENYLSSLLNGFLKSRDMLGVTEVLTSWKPIQIQAAKVAYKETFSNSFENDVMATLDDTYTDSIKNVIIPLSHLQRNNMNVEDLDEQDNVDAEVECLNEGGERIVEVLTQRPYSNTQLANIFTHYKLKFYLDLKESIDLDFHDTTQHCLKAIVKICSNCAHYFAEELHIALNEKNEARVIYIINSRYQNDLTLIAEIFEKDFSEQKSLNSQLEELFGESGVAYILKRLIKKTVR